MSDVSLKRDRMYISSKMYMDSEHHYKMLHCSKVCTLPDELLKSETVFLYKKTFRSRL